MRPLAIVRVAVCTSILGALCFAMMGAVSGDAVYDWVHTLEIWPESLVQGDEFRQ